MLDRAFWNDRKVFLTGHTGFKGSWLSLWLRNLGAEVSGFSDDIPSEPSHYSALGLDIEDRRGVGRAHVPRILREELRPDVGPVAEGDVLIGLRRGIQGDGVSARSDI